MGKLKYYGIKVAAFIWFVSYLKERKQHVLINAFNSKDLPISHVVQQGLFLDHFYFFFTSMIYVLLLNSVTFIIFLMTLIFCVEKTLLRN